MTRDEARDALRRVFVAGDVPPEWAELLVQVTEAAINEPRPSPAPARLPSLIRKLRGS